MKSFSGSLVFTAIALAAAAFLGFSEGGTLTAALSMAFLALILGIMETSLSLDNAVVNATILKDMNETWRRRFLTWGILIAVFGMRILFPLLIVSFSALVWPWEAGRIALFEPARYEQIVTGAHIGISGFGGAFLLLVGLSFFFDDDREHLWISLVERPLTALAKIPFVPYIVTVLVLAGLCFLIEGEARRTFLIAGVAGIAVYAFVQWFGDAVGGEEDATGAVVRTGMGAFLYLEVLDASFSFDGVIGAFAITNNILLIAIGLGIGAFFVRSMTVALVKGGHLSEFRFLEPGAFYAIMALAIIMLMSIRVATPEIVTGLIGAAILGAALLASIRHRQRFPEEYAEDGDADVIMPTGNVIGGAHTR
jgi:uncharacterized protein